MEELHDLLGGIDPEGARLAFTGVKAKLDQQSEYRRSNTDMNRAITLAASVGRMVKQAEVRTVFGKVDPEVFDHENVDYLEEIALATWYAALMHRSANARSSGGMLPDNAVAAATDIKHKMLRVVEYNLGDRDEVAAEVADIRAGRGYLDLSDDLMRLADLYERYADELVVDVRHYNADDRDLAKRLGQMIRQVLGDGRASEAQYWSDYLARAWTLLLNTYDEVSSTGRWLYRHSDGPERFPSLYAIGRRRRRDDDEASAPAPGDGTEPEPGDGLGTEPGDGTGPDVGDPPSDVEPPAATA